MKLFVGMKAIILREDGKILVIREAPYDEGTETGKWDVPGGRINPEEPILEGLKREVLEESGLDIEPLGVLGSGETFPIIKDEQCHIIRLYWLCRPLSGDVQLSADHSEYEWLDPQTIDDRIFVSDVREMILKAGLE